jgi:hypothetical protein
MYKCECGLTMESDGWEPYHCPKVHSDICDYLFEKGSTDPIECSIEIEGLSQYCSKCNSLIVGNGVSIPFHCSTMEIEFIDLSELMKLCSEGVILKCK